MNGLPLVNQQAQFQVAPKKNVLYLKGVPAGGYVDVSNIDVVMLYATTSGTLNGFTGGIPGQFLKVIISCSGGATVTVANLKTFNGLYNVGNASFTVATGTDKVKDYFNVSGPLGDNIWWDTEIGIDANTGFYGAFSDYNDQFAAAANTAYAITLGTTDLSNGVSVVAGSKITVAHSGVYNLQWSGQFINTDSQDQDVDIWIRINGTDVTGSNGKVTVPSKHGVISGSVLPAWNFVFSLNSGDYIQLYWATTNTTVSINTEAAASPHPSTASVIVTVTQQAAIISSGGGGVLGVANGGTGQTTYTDGQLLIGNTTGNTLTKATLTAGSNISITNGGGSITIASTATDPWTVIKLTSDYTTTSATPGTVNDATNFLRHRPAANTVTEYEAMLIIQTSVATNNPLTSFAWATSLTDGVAQIYQTGSGVGTLVYQSGNIAASVAIPAGGLPAATTSYPVLIKAFCTANSTSPGGFNQVQMAAETAGGTMTVKAGSYLKYRTL